ncbi:hypothetical protein BH20GEM2_BH20GEM2_04040 [soil metagenome]
MVPLAADDVRDAVRALAERLAASGSLARPEAIEAVYDERRIRDIIHVGDHVLLPHLRTDAVGGLLIALGVTPRPIAAGAEDPSATARIVVLVLAAHSASNLYLQSVAALARALRREETVRALLGAASAEDVLQIDTLWDTMIPPRLTVRDVMTQRVYRASANTPVRDVLEMAARHKLRAVPVVGEEREVLGMVTDRDLLRHLLPRVRRVEDDADGDGAPSPAETQVREIMSRSVMCISEDQGLAEVATIMVNKDVERLPVVSEGRLTGFLTRGDIIRKLFE